jgi:tripartite-type tricarboxylate transporter receptor subunit TctC
VASTRVRVGDAEAIQLLGQRVVVENRPGAGGIITIISSPGTGRWLRSHWQALRRSRTTRPYTASCRSRRKTCPVSLWRRGRLLRPGFAPRSIEELVAHAKSRPGQLTFASQGIGTFQHLAGEWFKVAAGVDLLHVPYKEYGQILTDLETGRVTLLFDSTGAVLGHVQGGKLKAFAVTGAQRLGSLPEVPTFAEAGLPTYEPSINYGVFAPAGTPPTVVESLSLAFAKVQRSKEIQESLARFGFSSQGTTSAEFASYIATERERWIKVVKASGVQLD